MIKWLVITSVTGSLVSLFVILFRSILLRKLGGSWYYYVSLLTVALFVVPVQLPITPDITPNNVLMSAGETFSEMIHHGTFFLESHNRTAHLDLVPDQAAEAPQSFSRDLPLPTLSQAATIIWICGFIFMLLRTFISYFRYKRKVIQRVPIDQVGNLDVVASDHVHSPLLIGFFRPTIVIPNRAISKNDYTLALLHEITHYKQGDAWIKLFAVIIHALHWYNPIAYLAIKNLNAACEYSCDEKVTKNMNINEKKVYSEMILTFASHPSSALSINLVNSKSQLFRRFELIMRNDPRTHKSTGVLMVSVMIAVTVMTTSVVFAEQSKPLVEDGGGMTTYYNHSQTLEENVRNTLRITTTTNQIRGYVIDAPFYIDEKGRKLDEFNRTEPYYEISREWKQKDVYLKEMTNKTLKIEGKNVHVAFSDRASLYKDDPVIEQMIRNQIAFELSYQSDRAEYDHAAFIDELITRGVYVIQNVTEAKDFQFKIRKMKNGDEWGEKPLTVFDKKNKLADIFNDKVDLLKNINGKQGTQIGENFVIRQGETLAIDIKETTDKMPMINWAIVDVTKGELVHWLPNALGGYRYIYTPGKYSANHTFKVVASGDESDHAFLELFTYTE